MIIRPMVRTTCTCSLLATCALLVACEKEASDQPVAVSSAPAAASSTTPAATSAPAARTDPRSRERPPWAWESAYQAALGPDPVLCGVTSAEEISGSSGCKDRVELPYVECSNVDARGVLERRHRDAFATRKVNLQREAAKREEEESAIWLPKKQAWIEQKKAMDAALQAGIVLWSPPPAAKVPLSYGAPGTIVNLEPALSSDPNARKMRDALAPYTAATDPIECEVMHVARIPRKLDPREVHAAVAAGKAAPSSSQSDVLTCWFSEAGRYSLALVLEIPVSPVRAKLSRSGDKGTVDGYEPAETVAEGALAAQLAGKNSDLAGRTIRVQGIRRLQRFTHGAFAYKYLKDRGVPMQMAIKTAEYKQVWIARFERACADVIEGCPRDDGLGEPRVSLVDEVVEPETSEASATAPPAKRKRKAPRKGGRGLWEDAVRAVDPEGNESAWERGLFVRPVEGAASLAKLGKPGEEAKIEQVTESPSEPVLRFREELQNLGGLRPFLCRVVEIGQEPNAPASPVQDAAMKAHGTTREIATQLQILCRGDQDSFDGPVLLFVPSYAAWAEVEGTGDEAKVKGYHLEKLGWFDPWLRQNLPFGVGISDEGATGDILNPAATFGQPPEPVTGTVLRVKAVNRLARRTGSNVAFGQGQGPVMWYASLGKMLCPHTGVGCDAQDGIKAPAIETVRGVPCDPEKFTYPPTKGALKVSIIDGD
jgi:hypothetical protein